MVVPLTLQVPTLDMAEEPSEYFEKENVELNPTNPKLKIQRKRNQSEIATCFLKWRNLSSSLIFTDEITLVKAEPINKTPTRGRWSTTGKIESQAPWFLVGM
ncbi:hypothetical protein Ancab_028420 [Ancistrocladus abbreviatus]